MTGDEDDQQSNSSVSDADGDVGDPVVVEKRKRSKRKREERGREFWKSILSDPVGREEIWNILRDAHTFEPRFACGPTGFPQPEASWVYAGEQAVGQRLHQSLLVIDLEGVRLMHLEHDKRFSAPEK